MKKFWKFLFGMMFVLCVMLPGAGEAQAAWDGTAATSFYSGTGTATNPYTIRTEKHMAYFAKALQEDNFEGQYISLQYNLDMTGAEWSTGTADFAGTFLGNGKTVTINDSFLWRITATGTVDWLNLRNTETMAEPLLCEYNDGIIQNCRVEGDVYEDATSTAALLCTENSGIVANSSGFGSVEGHGDDCDCWVGWISKSTGTIKNCYTVLTLSASASGDYTSSYKGEITATGSYTNCYTGTAVLANDADFVNKLNQSLDIPGYVWAVDTANTNGGYPFIKKCLAATVQLGASSEPMFTYHSTTLSTTMSSDVTGCTIYYTLDGSDPTTSSTRKTYSGSVQLQGTGPVTMVAYKSGEYSRPSRQYIVQMPGAGTAASPYQISTKAGLCAIYLEPAAVYELTCDLDFTDGGYVHNGIEVTEWTSIPEFSGTLKGNCHSITGLVSSTGGLFDSVLDGGLVQELRLLDHRLSSKTTSNDFGAIANGNAGTITRCYASGRSSNKVLYYNYVGGIVGYNRGTITYCNSSGYLSTYSSDNYSRPHIGGIAGMSRGTIRKCYSDAMMITGNTRHDMGGSVGGITTNGSGSSDGGYVYDCRFDGQAEVNAYMASYGVGIATFTGDSTYGNSNRCYDGGAIFNSTQSGNRDYYATEYALYKATGTGKDRILSAFPDFDFDTVWMMTPDGPMPQGIMQADGKYYTKASYTAPGMETDGKLVCYVNGGSSTETFVVPATGVVMGTYGDNLTWERTVDGALTITGKGAMDGNDIWDFPWYYDSKSDTVIASQITSVTLGSGITTVAPYAFYKTGAATVSLPSTLTTIGDYAFDRSNITELTLPASLTNLGYGAFYGKTVTLTFLGNAPTFSLSAFHGAKVTAYYPANNTTWTSDVRQQYGGDVTWVCNGTCSHNSSYRTTVNYVAATCTTEGYSGDRVCRLCDVTVQTGSVTTPLGHNEVRQVGLEPTCTEDGYITVTCSRCDYTDQEPLAALGHRIREGEGGIVDPLTVANTSASPFAKSGNTYTSTNKSHSTSSEIRITALYDFPLTLTYSVSSESGCDKLIILINGTQKDAISGTLNDKVMTLDLKAGDVVTVRYSKDSSVSTGKDQGWVTLKYELINLDIPAETVEANCRAAVVCDYCQTVVKERLPHTEVVDEAVAPTCGATGLTEGSHCEVCGETTLPQETVPATGRHQYDLDEGYDATCTEPGLTFGSSCHVCGLVHAAQEAIPATGHTAVTDKTVAPTCTETGLTEGSHCGTCGEVLVAQDSVPALGHTDGTPVTENEVAPNCTANGSYDTVVYCVTCGDELSRVTTPVPALGHTAGEPVTENEVAPTCTVEGSYDTAVYCTVCDAELSRVTTPVNALGHTEVIDEAVESTCTATGLTEGSHCGVCGEVLVAQQVTLEKTHTVVMDNPKPATCTEPGLKGTGMHCSVCGVVLLAQQEIPALGHSWTDATCAAPKTCQTCEATEGEALEHTWTDATCTAPKTCLVCTATEGEANGHDWKDATCTEPATCEVCEMTEGEPASHAWKPATCTAPKTCEVCEATEGDPAGHNWKPATCTAPKTCEVCEMTEGEPAGHEWKDATCTTPKTCEVCEATEGEPAGHDWKPATCTTPKTCEVCEATEGEAAGHDWKDATCVTPKTCEVCEATEGDPAGHAWKPATCTEPKTCEVCEMTEGEPAGHDWKAATCTAPKSCQICEATEGEPAGHNWKPATCTTPKTCEICEATEGEPAGHNWKDATCTAPKTCEVCEATEGEPAGHAWKPATCTASKTCEVCEATEGEPAGHAWKPATCTAPATCEVCEATEGEPAGHNWKDATCTEPATCEVCEATEGEPAGHNWKPATCTAPKTCEVCEVTEGDPAGHNWKPATCTTPKTCEVCEVTEGEPAGHNWKPATCTAPKTCEVCEATEGEPAGHNWKDATCTAPKTCEVCEVTEGDPTGHTEVFHEGKQPTCSEGGWKDYVTCESCDYTTYEALGATGEHTYDAYGKCIYCKTSKAPAVYDPETATIVLHEVPEGTEKILISAYSEMGQLVGTAAGAVGVEIYLPFGESAYRICVYCFDSLWRPVGQSYILFP